jgi:hypothetical protein
VTSSEVLTLPQTGFVFYRAESPRWSPQGILPIVGFTLVTEAERPNGSGGFDLSITSTENSGILLVAWRSAGAEGFTTPYGQITLPFNTTVQGLPDGEWELAFLSSTGLEPVSGGPFENVSAPLCLTETADCNTAPTSLWVKDVTVEDGQLTAVDIGLGRPEEGGSSNQAVQVGLPAGGAAVAVLSLAAVGYVVMRRRHHAP